VNILENDEDYNTTERNLTACMYTKSPKLDDEKYQIIERKNVDIMTPFWSSMFMVYFIVRIRETFGSVSATIMIVAGFKLLYIIITYAIGYGYYSDEEITTVVPS
jgi:hypothetical protein